MRDLYLKVPQMSPAFSEIMIVTVTKCARPICTYRTCLLISIQELAES